MVIREEIEIRAPLETVWSVFSCLEDWEKWNAVCRNCCYLEGAEMSRGACISFVISPFILPIQISPQITKCVPGREIVWEGERLGIHAEHAFVFRQEGDKVVLLSIERFRGPMILPSRFLLVPSRLHRLTRQLLSDIKKESERRASGA